ncbi:MULTISPECIES: ABC transporter ATP-binding protein [Thiorhodovibrio]|uniref:ABC transporter ATP-binding protein n=1 Tax=Thiorhodovibrio TaxID=61593 RepID=UPI0019136F2C|nr:MULTISPECIES: ABC transporter ATP-binding protein [Thiorhodovibrio]MBK5970491.1 methionine ABC transporter ATP-binding protein [Thiorhodovibrio winogradskyi]WPL12510.1 putative ABC transporter ATP-binding protein [Thiorhodovibrio litoralis]
MVIDIQNLEFRWHPLDAPVLRIPTLQVTAGEHLFVRGPSGSGKSTLLGLLAGVSTAETGSVRVLDGALERLGQVERDHFRADHIGYIFQMFNLIPFLSVIDNVLLPCRFSRRRRERALQASGSLTGEARRLLAHLDLDHPELLGRAVTTLSVGQQQRVAAARALMGAPELVIADEPTSALDAHRRESFIELLFDECRRTGATLVFVSHDAGLEPLFDRSFALDERQPGGAVPMAGEPGEPGR